MSVQTQFPQAGISRKKGISLVWIVPIVALVVGAGLVYKTITEKGPAIEILFESAEGLEAGKTKIKYKDVDIGKVKDVTLTHDLKGVKVSAALAREAKGYLTEQTRFWVVRPRLTGSTVSGMDTLLSGAYIAIEPGREGAPRLKFKGLEVPPLVTRDSKGRLFTLKAGELQSLDYGSPVYFRGVKVGQVTGYGLDKEEQGVDIRIFIDAPHDRMVSNLSKFWAVSGINMNVGTDGLQVNTQSLVSILMGGIELYTPQGTQDQNPVEEGQIFTLYASRETAMEKSFARKKSYLLKFSQSVRGLDIGAPVEFRGFELGRVAQISLEYDSKADKILVPVRIEVEEERLHCVSYNAGSGKEKITMDQLVSKGMRGQLSTGNLLTGKLFVALDFFTSQAPAKVIDHGDIIEIPTIPTPLEALTNNLVTIIGKIQKLPFEDIGTGLKDAVQSFKTAGNAVKALAESGELAEAVKGFGQIIEKVQILADKLSSTLPPTVDQARQTLKDAGGVLSRDAAVVVELRRTLDELSQAAKAVQALADELEQHPESLLRGKEKK
nr:MlaD family protein [uncultured Desulfobacter sp.]